MPVIALYNGQLAQPPAGLACHRHLSTRVLKNSSHSATSLSAIVIENANRRKDSLNALQRAAYTRFWEDPIFSTSNRGNNPETAIFRAYFDFFDDMFFCGVLKRSCQLRLSGKNADTLQEYGVTVPRPTRTGIISSATIIVHVPTHLKDQRERRLFQIGTLLHEMLHGFLEVYTCRREGCLNSIDWLGKTGHGMQWHYAAHALERAVHDRRYLSLAISIGRRSSLQHELLQWGNPPIENLGALGFSEEDIKRTPDGWYNVNCTTLPKSFV